MNNNEVPVTDAQHRPTLVGPYLQCRGAPEIRLVNNQRHPTPSSHVPIRSRCTPGPPSSSKYCPTPDGENRETTKAGSHRQTGFDLRAVLVAPGSTLFRSMPKLFRGQLY